MPNVYFCKGCGHDNYFHIEDSPCPEAYSCQSCWYKIPFAEAEKLDAAKLTDEEFEELYADYQAERQAEDRALAAADAAYDRQVNEGWYAGVTVGGYNDEIPF